MFHDYLAELESLKKDKAICKEIKERSSLKYNYTTKMVN